MSRCTGHCCKSFWLPTSPIELAHQAKRAKLRKSKFDQDDCLKIADMVIYQRPHEKGGHRYTCKHFDAISGNCTNYENRPKMCSEYPYGSKCKFKLCTMVQTDEGQKHVDA